MMSKISFKKGKNIHSIVIGDIAQIWFVLFIVSLTFIINNPQIKIIVVMSAALLNIVYYIKLFAQKYKNNIVILLFNFTFMLFLMGGFIIKAFEGNGTTYFRNNYFYASDEAISHTVICIYLSIVIINIFYNLFSKKIVQEEDLGKTNLKTNDNIRFFSGLFLIISWVAKLLYEVDKAIYLKAAGYYEYYTSYSSNLPSIVQYVMTVYYMLLFIYLVNLPSKLRAYIAMSSYFIIAIVMLYYGERSEPMCGLLALACFYILYGTKYKKTGSTKINYKKTMITIMAIILCIYVLQLVQEKRDGNDTDSFMEMVNNFIVSQGGAAKTIANSYDLRDEITEIGGKSFTFGIIRNYLTQNVVTRKMLGIDNIKLHTLEWATSGNSFAASYGYAYSPVTFNNGRGSGTVYIAELWHDFGYIGLVIGNIIISIIIILFSKKQTNWLMAAISLNVIRNIIYLPRDAYFSFLTSTFALPNLLVIGSLYLIFQRRQKERIKNEHRFGYPRLS